MHWGRDTARMRKTTVSKLCRIWPAPTRRKVMKIETRKLSELQPATYNPRTISDSAFAALRKSISRWGLVQPIIINETSGNIVGGHARLRVLQEQGETETPVVIVSLPEAE